MNRDVENAGIAVKHVLSAITMVNVLATGMKDEERSRRWLGIAQKTNVQTCYKNGQVLQEPRSGSSSAKTQRQHQAWLIETSYPVNNEDLADAELVLKLLGSDGHWIEVTETPDRHRQQMTACSEN